MDDMRSARGCTLHGVHPVERKPTAKLYQIKTPAGQTLSAYMGHYPDRTLAGTTVLGVPQFPDSPFEPPENGCPGAWYRSPFIDSLWPFMRRRTKGGGRVPNPKFDSADWFVQEAVAYYEQEEERCIAYIREIEATRAQAAKAKTEPEPPPRGARGRKRGR
jgi:hypothetical protein